MHAQKAAHSCIFRSIFATCSGGLAVEDWSSNRNGRSFRKPLKLSSLISSSRTMSGSSLPTRSRTSPSKTPRSSANESSDTFFTTNCPGGIPWKAIPILSTEASATISKIWSVSWWLVPSAADSVCSSTFTSSLAASSSFDFCFVSWLSLFYWLWESEGGQIRQNSRVASWKLAKYRQGEERIDPAKTFRRLLEALKLWSSDLCLEALKPWSLEVLKLRTSGLRSFGAKVREPFCRINGRKGAAFLFRCPHHRSILALTSVLCILSFPCSFWIWRVSLAIFALCLVSFCFCLVPFQRRLARCPWKGCQFEQRLRPHMGWWCQPSTDPSTST